MRRLRVDSFYFLVLLPATALAACNPGMPKTARALSPSTPDKLFTYRVLKPFEVIKGRTAPAFGELGFGVQYETPVPISILLKRGIVEEVK